MKSKPLISVIIPAYNEEELLPKCLESFKTQTFRDFEIIVVDNNSTDKTAEIAEKYDARVVKEKIQGMIPARERGFREAKAEIIARTDADTIVPPDWLEIIYRILMKEKQLAGVTGPFYSKSGKISDYIIKIWSFILIYILGKMSLGHIPLIGSNMALRKSFWKNIHVHTDDRLFLEDWDLSCHLSELGELKYEPKLTVPLATRRFKTISGLMNYLTRYPFRYFITIWTHHPFFRRHQ